MKLNEVRILSAIHPTDNQKRILAKIVAAPTSKVGGEDISNDVNLVAARNILVKLGLIAFNNGEATLTDQGTQVAQDENIIDQTGALTPTGEALAFTTPAGNEDRDTAGEAQTDQSIPTESFKLLKQLLS